MKTIGIIDYGMGNLHSVKNALDFIGFDSIVSGDISELDGCAALILPGVGAFGDAMKSLDGSGLTEFIKNAVKAQKKPLLGICLGMQLLFDKSFEFGEHVGLGLIGGEVIRLAAAYKIPHMGWNSINFGAPSPLFDGIAPGSYFYFVHSFKGVPSDKNALLAYCEYGETIAAACGEKNIFGTQFHPEKSERAGLKILENFRRMII